MPERTGKKSPKKNVASKKAPAKKKPASRRSKSKAAPKEPSNTCFVLMPFAREFDELFSAAIKPAIRKAGIEALRADSIRGPGPLTEQIYRALGRAHVVIAVLSKSNANVFYELGIAHTLGKPVILLSEDVNRVPFDLRSFRIIEYRPTPQGASQLRKMLVEALGAVLADSGAFRSPVSAALGEHDLVPRSELESTALQLATAKEELGEAEQRIETLSKNRGDGVALEHEEQLKTFFLHTIKRHVVTTERSYALATAQLEQLRVQRARDQEALNELRELRRKIVVRPHWSGQSFDVEPDLCFLLMPFSEPWSDAVWRLIGRIVTQAGFRCERADEKDGRVIMDDIWQGVNKARLVVADLTGKNPNVTYEVGLADVLGKDVVLLSQTPDDVPFDFLGIRLITYENDIAGVESLTDALTNRLRRLKTDAKVA